MINISTLFKVYNLILKMIPFLTGSLPNKTHIKASFNRFPTIDWYTETLMVFR